MPCDDSIADAVQTDLGADPGGRQGPLRAEDTQWPPTLGWLSPHRLHSMAALGTRRAYRRGWLFLRSALGAHSFNETQKTRLGAYTLSQRRERVSCLPLKGTESEMPMNVWVSTTGRIFIKIPVWLARILKIVLVVVRVVL